MADYFGNELKEGDEVAFMRVKYRGLCDGVVKKVHNSMVTISHKKQNTGKTETKQYHSQVFKKPQKMVIVSDEDEVWYLIPHELLEEFLVFQKENDFEEYQKVWYKYEVKENEIVYVY